MNRRKFLKITGLSGAAILAVPGIGYITTSVQDAAVGIIKNELHYLHLEEAGIEQFVADYYRNHYINQNFSAKLKIRSYYYFHVKPEKSYMVQELVDNYLLSTDFFLNKMDESREVKYVGLYHPYQRPCAHPFSALQYPPAAV